MDERPWQVEIAAFTAELGAYFELEPGTIHADSHLADDLAFDSIMVRECMLMIEDLAGHPIDEAALREVRTVRDLYNFYIQAG